MKAKSARADGLDPDAGALLDFLHIHGPHSYGAAATALGWGATRAWQAEAKLRAAGLVGLGRWGHAEARKERVLPRGEGAAGSR